jgi:hypothetical protein
MAANGGQIQRFAGGTDKPIKVGKTNASGGVFMHLDPGPIIKNLFGPGSRKGRGLSNIGITLGGNAAKWNQQLRIGKADISKEELVSLIANTSPEELFSQQLQISRNGKKVRSGAGTFRGGVSSEAYMALAKPGVLSDLKKALLASAQNLKYPITSDKGLYPLGKAMLGASDGILRKGFSEIREVVYTDLAKGKERRDKAKAAALENGEKIKKTSSEVRRRWTKKRQEEAQAGNIRVVTQRGGRYRYNALGGLIQRFSEGTDEPLTFPGRAKLLTALFSNKKKFPDMRAINALIGGQDARKVLGGKNPSGPDFDKLMKEYGRVTASKTAKKEKEKRLASTREFAVLGLKGPTGTSQEVTPLLKSKTKGTFKPKDVTVHKGVLSGFLSKRLEAIARKGYRETVAQMAAVLAQRAGTPAVSDKKALNAIIKKTFQGGGLGQMFESAVAAADSRSFYPTGKINTPMDLPKGSGVAGLFGVKGGIPTDVTVNTEENKTAQMGRFLRDKKLRRSRRSLGGILQRLAGGGRAYRKVDFEKGVGPSPFSTGKSPIFSQSQLDGLQTKFKTLKSYEIDQQTRLAKDLGITDISELEKRLQSYAIAKSQRIDPKTDPKKLAASLQEPEFKPSTLKQIELGRRLAIGGEVQRLFAGTSGPLRYRKRITGLIDVDKLRDSKRAREAMQKLGFYNPKKDSYDVSGYRDSLANAALAERQKGAVHYMAADLGSPGAGKSTFGLKGKGSKRYIETIEDLQEMIASGNRVSIRNAMASLDEDKIRHLSKYDRIRVLSSTTPEEMKELKKRLKNRTRQGKESIAATGVDTTTQFNRKHTIKAQSSEDTEAMLRFRDENGKQIIDESKIATYSISTGKRKKAHEVPMVRHEALNVIKGGFGPTTREGHVEGLFKKAKKDKKLLINVGPDESLTDDDLQEILSGSGKAHGARTVIFDRKTRKKMVEKSVKDENLDAYVSTSGDGFGLASLFKVGKDPKTGQSIYTQPDKKKSTIVIGEDRAGSEQKYRDMGYDNVQIVPRGEGAASASKVRDDMFEKRDFSGVTPSVRKMLEEASQRGVFENTLNTLPKVVQHVQKKAQARIASIDIELDKLLASVPGGRLTQAFREQNPELAKEIERLRAKKSDIKGSAKRSDIHAAMRNLKKRYPEKYGFLDNEEESSFKPQREFTGKRFQRAAIGGEIPIMAQEGEFVLNKHAAGQIGPHTLEKLNRGGRVAAGALEQLPKYHSGGSVQKFKVGGVVGKSYNDLASPLDALQKTSKKESLLDPSYQEQREKAEERILRSRARQKKRTKRLQARHQEAMDTGDIGSAFDVLTQIDETKKKRTRI